MENQKDDEFESGQAAAHDGTKEDVPAERVKGRTIKLTAKALLAKISDLETLRKSKLNKAANSKATIQSLMAEPCYENEINKSFNVYQVLINDAKDAHNKLLELLPVEEKEKHDVWFKEKLLSVNEFSQNVAKYQTCVTDKMVENIDNLVDAEIKPTDSVSNVGSNSSIESRNSSR